DDLIVIYSDESLDLSRLDYLDNALSNLVSKRNYFSGKLLSGKLCAMGYQIFVVYSYFIDDPQILPYFLKPKNNLPIQNISIEVVCIELFVISCVFFLDARKLPLEKLTIANIVFFQSVVVRHLKVNPDKKRVVFHGIPFRRIEDFDNNHFFFCDKGLKLGIDIRKHPICS
ncbi:hypothetical protein ACJX0J_019989, partial [Zea mays]